MVTRKVAAYHAMTHRVAVRHATVRESVNFQAAATLRIATYGKISRVVSHSATLSMYALLYTVNQGHYAHTQGMHRARLV